MMNEKTKENLRSLILDSSHILTTFPKVYDVKLVDCASYQQIYLYKRSKIKKTNKEDGYDLNLIRKTSFDDIVREEKNSSTKMENTIENRSIIRSKLKCQRIAKCNMEDWKTFITLTFAENITDLKQANKRFRYFIDKVQRVQKDFKYLCITEFQKRGAIHYHLLTNIDITNEKLMYVQNDNKKFYHIKYWNEGFTSVEIMKNDPKKVIGYISKYMTKDIDQRLFNRHRYFYSRNLNIPKISYIDLQDERDYQFLTKKVQDKKLIYRNEYENSYDKNQVTFLELS